MFLASTRGVTKMTDLWTFLKISGNGTQKLAPRYNY